MIIALAGWLGSLGGRLALGAGIIGSLIALRACDKQQQRAAVVAEIRQATDETIRKSDSAGRKSADPRSRGVLNPYTRRD